MLEILVVNNGSILLSLKFNTPIKFGGTVNPYANVDAVAKSSLGKLGSGNTYASCNSYCLTASTIILSSSHSSGTLSADST